MAPRDDAVYAGLDAILDAIPRLDEKFFKPDNERHKHVITLDAAGISIRIAKAGITSTNLQNLDYVLTTTWGANKDALRIYIFHAVDKESSVIRTAFTSGVEKLRATQQEIRLAQPDANDFV
ncbi:hypothetical protein BV20DRAFT_966347 [Pilatotrama ljubarskyi]|nr:hypothetical protein BV20DRAFT_966347 [Pilatotrama ljubarskyi]